MPYCTFRINLTYRWLYLCILDCVVISWQVCFLWHDILYVGFTKFSLIFEDLQWFIFCRPYVIEFIHKTNILAFYILFCLLCRLATIKVRKENSWQSHKQTPTHKWRQRVKAGEATRKQKAEKGNMTHLFVTIPFHVFHCCSISYVFFFIGTILSVHFPTVCVDRHILILTYLIYFNFCSHLSLLSILLWTKHVLAKCTMALTRCLLFFEWNEYCGMSDPEMMFLSLFE